MGRLTLTGVITSVVVFILLFIYLSTKIELGPEGVTAANLTGFAGVQAQPVSAWDAFWTAIDIQWPDLSLW